MLLLLFLGLLESAASFSIFPKPPISLMKVGKTISSESHWSSVCPSSITRRLRMTSKSNVVWYVVAAEDAPLSSHQPPVPFRAPTPFEFLLDFLSELRSSNPVSVGFCDLSSLTAYQTQSDFISKQGQLKWMDKISDFGVDEQNPLYVVIPSDFQKLVPMDSRAPTGSIQRMHPRQDRWDKLNVILGRISAVKKSSSDTVPFSAVTWYDVGNIFVEYITPFSLPVKPILPRDLEVLHNCLSSVQKCFGNPFTGNEAKRLYFIAPILVCVCLVLKDVQIQVEENMRGGRIKTNGKFEFVLCRGGKKVCIAETGDMYQGRAQALLGCETLCDIENLSVVYCVITNFETWHFIKSADYGIEVEVTNLVLARGVPTRASLFQIAGKLIELLS